jgi:hypothetical protein
MHFARHHLAVVVLAALFHASLLMVNMCAAPRQGNANGLQATDQTAMNNDNSHGASPGGESREATPAAAEAPAANSSTDADADDLSFETRIRMTGRDQLLVSYTVRNRGRQPVLLMNRPPARAGASAPSSNPNFVYVETLADGVVEISKRVKEPPRETTVFIPDVLGATLLAPGRSFSEEVRVDLAARRRTSAQPTRDVPGIPDPVRRVRFCLGAAPAEGITTRAFGQGKHKTLYPDAGAVLSKQRVLCGETIEVS